MERKLQERMVGAGVLILVLVILAPMILDGGRDEEDAAVAVPGQRSDEMRSHTFSLDQNVPSSSVTPPAAGENAVPTLRSAPMPSTVSEPPAPPPPQALPPPAAPAVPPPAVVKPAPAPAPAPPVTASPKPPTVAAERSGSSSWVVQVGTFGQKANADRLVVNLKKDGFDAFVSPTERSGKELYRVRVGPAGSREAATAIAGRLARSGQSGQVVSQ
jgi:DedD protein